MASEHLSNLERTLKENALLKKLNSRLSQKIPLVSQTCLSSFSIDVDPKPEPDQKRNMGVTCSILDPELLRLNHAADVNELNG